MAERALPDLKSRIRIDTSQLVVAEGQVKGFGRSFGGAVRPATTDAKKFEEAMHHSSIALGATSKETDNLSRKLGGLQGLMSGGAGLAASALAVTAGVGLAVIAGKSAVDITEKREVAERHLSQALSTSTVNQADLNRSIQEFIDKNRSYISDQNAVIEGFATLTREGLSFAKIQRDMNIALDLSATKGISLADAIDLVSKAEEGRFRGLIGLGINVKGLNKDNADAAAGAKDLTKETDDLASAQRALLEFETGLHAKRTVTKLDLLHEEDAKKKVADATLALNAAQAKSTQQIDVINTALDELSTKEEGGRKTTSDLTQASNRLGNTWQDIAVKVGPPLIGTLAAISIQLDAVVTSLEKVGDKGGPGGKGFWDGLNNGLISFIGHLDRNDPFDRIVIEWAQAQTHMSEASRDHAGIVRDSVDDTKAAIQSEVQSQQSATEAIQHSYSERDQTAQESAAGIARLYAAEATAAAGSDQAQTDAIDHVTQAYQRQVAVLADTYKQEDAILKEFESSYADHLGGAAQAVQALTNQYGGLVGGGSGSTYGARAAGGPVVPNSVYTVGESGPETLVMGSKGGYVVPGTGGGSGGGMTVLPVVFSPLPPSREQIVVINEHLRRFQREHG